jgi:hypothetical protein
MPNFAQFLANAAEKGEVVNILFEERLFDLVGVLHKITDTLTAEGIPHELIGGLAVFIHVEEADPTHSILTRDVDLMVRREDLDRIKQVAAKKGFRFRHAAGLDILLYGDADSAKNAVRLVFKNNFAPKKKRILGEEVLVIPVADLLRMKLSAFRDKDRVHVRSMDAAGLITTGVEENWRANFASGCSRSERRNNARAPGNLPQDDERVAAAGPETENGEVLVEGSRALDSQAAHHGEAGAVDD